MESNLLIPLLDRVHGATFATINSVTWPNKSVRCVSEGERVILFRTKGGSGYERMVKRRLAEAGKSPDAFSVGPLPWGERVGDLPLIQHKGNYYLQCIRLAEPSKRTYYIGTTDIEISPDRLDAFGVTKRSNLNQDLPPDEQVEVCCFKLESITSIVLMGERIGDTQSLNKRSILKIKPAS